MFMTGVAPGCREEEGGTGTEATRLEGGADRVAVLLFVIRIIFENI